MTFIPPVSAGTIDLANGSTTVAGFGTNFLSAGAKGGDILVIGVTRVEIQEVVSNTNLELLLPWDDVDVSGGDFYIVSRNAETLAAENATEVRRLLQRLGTGLLPRPDAVGTLAERSMFDNQDASNENPFIYTATDNLPREERYIKIGPTANDWLGPAFISSVNSSPDAFDFSGFGTPSTTLGEDGEDYLNKTNGDTYQRISGSWVIQGSIAGQGISSFPNRAELKSSGAPLFSIVALQEGDRTGLFAVQSGDFSSQVATDVDEGIFIELNHIPASDGALVRIFDGPALPEWFGIVANGSDVTARLNSYFAVSEPFSALLREGDYGISASSNLLLGTNTFINKSVTFKVLGTSAGANYAITVPAGAVINRINVELDAGNSINRVVSILGDSEVGQINVLSEDQIANTSNGFFSAVNVSGDNNKIGDITIEGFDNAFTWRNSTQSEIGDLRITRYLRGFFSQNVKSFNLGNVFQSIRSVNSRLSAGHNSMLFVDTQSGSIGNFQLHHAGEHAIRFGGSSGTTVDNGCRNIIFGDGIIEKAGGSGIKCLDTTSGAPIPTNIIFGSVDVIDAGDEVTAGDGDPDDNEAGARLENFKNIKFTRLRVFKKDNAFSAFRGLHINGGSGLICPVESYDTVRESIFIQQNAGTGSVTIQRNEDIDISNSTLIRPGTDFAALRSVFGVRLGRLKATGLFVEGHSGNAPGIQIQANGSVGIDAKSVIQGFVGTTGGGTIAATGDSDLIVDITPM